MEIRSIWRKRYETLFFQSQRRHAESNISRLSGCRRCRHVVRLAGDGLRLPAVGTVCTLYYGTGGRPKLTFIGIVASGGNPLAAAAAGLLVNARHVPFGVTVRDLVGNRAASFLGCHIMNDESVVFGRSKNANNVKPPTGFAVWASRFSGLLVH